MTEKTDKSLKVLEPIKMDVKTFNDKQEFEMFFNSHREEFESSTTTKLNRMYRIPGYRITRQKNQLCLKKDYTKANSKEVLDEMEIADSIQDKLNKWWIDIQTELEDRINDIQTELEDRINDRLESLQLDLKFKTLHMKLTELETPISKLEAQLKLFETKIKKMEKIVNQQTEFINQMVDRNDKDYIGLQ